MFDLEIILQYEIIISNYLSNIFGAIAKHRSESPTHQPTLPTHQPAEHDLKIVKCWKKKFLEV